jgi:hypothetical protein
MALPMSEIKKVKRKLRSGPVIEVDAQILRWRQRLKREAIALGKKTENQKRKNEIQREDRRLEAQGGITKRKWFG